MGGKFRLRFLQGLVLVAASSILLIVILLSNLQMVAFSLNHYENQYNILGRAEAIGMTETELLRVTGEMLDYLKGARQDLAIEAEINGTKTPFFTERELSHMIDVQKLFAKGYMARNGAMWLLVILLALSAALFGRSWFEGLVYILNRSSLLALSVLVITSLITAVNFTFWFDQFHFLTFDNDLWLLDPRQHNLIKIVPQEFFQNTASAIITQTIGVLLLLVLSSSWYLFRQKGKAQDDLRAGTSQIL